MPRRRGRKAGRAEEGRKGSREDHCGFRIADCGLNNPRLCGRESATCPERARMASRRIRDPEGGQEREWTDFPGFRQKDGLGGKARPAPEVPGPLAVSAAPAVGGDLLSDDDDRGGSREAGQAQAVPAGNVLVI